MEAMSARADERHLRKLLKHEVAHAIREGAELGIGWNMGDAPNATSLRRTGFLPLPERFRPVEIHFGARALKGELPLAMMDGKRWYLSYLNSDTV
jgi:hypothetical protein